MTFDANKVHTVLLIEDDTATRERLWQVVNDRPEFSVIADAGDCETAIPLIHKLQPDVMLVDLGLPDGSGIDLIREAQDKSPATETMVITSFGDERHVISAIEAGATGYLVKDGEPNYIADSILQMLAGGSPISPSIARHLLKKLQPQQQEPDAPHLTTREKEVLELVAKGFSYAEIGDVLSMSTHTVTSHIKHIYRKLSVNSRGQAVFEAMQLGLINKPS
ncbi:MAG: response regulator transcription factor [Cellvibrionaceae bacterium]